MAYKCDIPSQECCVAEHVIGVHVRVDDPPDGKPGAFFNRFDQSRPLFAASPGVDHRDRHGSDHKADVGDGPTIASDHQRIDALMDENAWSDLFDFKFLNFIIGQGR